MRKMRDRPFIYISAAVALGVCIFLGKVIFTGNHLAAKKSETTIIVANVSNIDDPSKVVVVPEPLNAKSAFDRALEAEEPVTAEAHSIGVGAADACTVAEFAGAGPGGSKISTKNWTGILVQYRGLKAKILSWLEADYAKSPQKYTEESYAWMQAQIKGLRVQRPVNADEPDLSWRGIGALSYDSSGVLLRMGGGFLSLLKLNPPRARFELARLIAQVWSPCEFEKAKQASPWADTLKCLGVDPAAKCDNSLSETAWAVSSAVAKVVANPGCRVPAFTDESVACLNGEHPGAKK